MSEPDLRAAFAELCADMPAGETREGRYEETLGIAVQRLGRRRRGPGAAEATPFRSGAASMEPDCPFMISVAALARGHTYHSHH